VDDRVDGFDARRMPMRPLKTVMSDLDLKESVEGQLLWDPFVDARDVRVAAREGSIALTGSVPSSDQKRAAVRAAKRVYGVNAVEDDLDVKPHDQTDSSERRLRWRSDRTTR
jgi:osmotically-inducible protein OsmY